MLEHRSDQMARFRGFVAGWWLAVLLAALLACAGCAPEREVVRRGSAVTVQASWTARTASQVVQRLAAPLEAELAGIKGVSQMVTRCDAEGCRIVLHCAPGVDSLGIAFEASSAVKRAEPKLPSGSAAVTYASDLARPPDVTLALMLDAKEVQTSHYAAAVRFADGVLRLPDVLKQEVPGQPVTTHTVHFDATRAAKWGVTQAEVMAAIEQKVLIVDEHTRVLVTRRAWGSHPDVGDILLKQVDGRAVKVRDVARVRRSATPAGIYHVNGKPAVLVHVFLRSGLPAAAAQVCVERMLGQLRPAPIHEVLVLKGPGR